MSTPPTNFLDFHIFSLPSQGSIYTLCRLPCSNPNNQARLLVASLRRPVFLLEFNQGIKHSLIPHSRELNFTNVLGHTEIISITAFTKQGSTCTIIAVAYIKVGDANSGPFLNVYIMRDIGPDLSPDELAFSCSVEIDYIPYHLTHCAAANDMFLILSGSDNRVHVYCEDLVTHMASEKEDSGFFPEFKDSFPSVVLWIDFYIIPEKYRFTSVGCECGAFFLFIFSLKSNSIVSTCTTNLGTSVTSSRFFATEDHVNLLVTNALLPAMIYLNVLSNELKEPFTLDGSEKHDVITCCLVTDLQMDQKPTILLGTYGQELLAYRFVDEAWCLSWQRSFSHPILALDYCDVTGDGVRELVALTTRGVQILQHDMDQVTKILMDRDRKSVV